MHKKDSLASLHLQSAARRRRRCWPWLVDATCHCHGVHNNIIEIPVVLLKEVLRERIQSLLAAGHFISLLKYQPSSPYTNNAVSSVASMQGVRVTWCICPPILHRIDRGRPTPSAARSTVKDKFQILCYLICASVRNNNIVM